jgi:stress-induced-phosphoprotein 1
MDAYEEALRVDPTNAPAKAGMESLQRAIESEGPGGGGDPMGGLGNMFSDPQLFQKLAANPKTAPLLADTEFMQKLQRLQKDPKSGGLELRDPRFLQVMGVLLGIDMSFGGPGGPGEAASAAMGNRARDAEEDEEMPDFPPSSKPGLSREAPRAAPEEVSESEAEDEEEKVKKEAKIQADEEKKLGTENYKKRQFDEAIVHYSKAWELHKDITYLTNLGAAYFEKKDYENCISTCQKAVEEGREVLADFKLIAKYVAFKFVLRRHTNFVQGIRSHRKCLRKAERPSKRNHKLSKVSDRAPHTRHTDQAPQCRKGPCESREGILHEPRKGRRST